MRLSRFIILTLATIFIICDTVNAENDVPIFTPYPDNPLLVSKTIVAKKIFKEGNEYRMHFIETNSSGTYPADFNSDLIISNDGLDWNPNAIIENVISPTQSGKTFNYYVAEIKESDTYKAWHSATSNSNIAGTELYYSTSPDGLNFYPSGGAPRKVLPNGTYPEYDSRNINEPYVVHDGTKYHLYYSAYPGDQTSPPNRDFHTTIAYAWSEDGIVWTKHDVVIDIGTEGSFDSDHVYGPVVIYDGAKFEMFYNGSDGSDTSVGYAVSDDGEEWEKIGKVDSIDGTIVGAIKSDSIYKAWYIRGVGNNQYELCYATTTETKGMYVSSGRPFYANGKELIMRGINHAHTWYRDETSSFANIKNTGANTIRVVLSSGDRWPKNENSDVANVIQLCKTNNLVCILEVHDTSGFGEKSEAISLAKAVNYWKSIQSVLTGEEAYVIINIGNEPYGNINPGGWTSATINAIEELRNAEFDHMIMVDAPNWGQDSSFIMRDNANAVFNSDPHKNTVFSIHMYGQFNTDRKINSYLMYFINNGLPIVIGEFGHKHTDGNPDEDAIMARAKEYGIGYIAWAWSGNTGGVEYLDLVNNFNPNSLTWWGCRLINGVNGIRGTSKYCPKSFAIPAWIQILLSDDHP